MRPLNVVSLSLTLVLAACSSGNGSTGGQCIGAGDACANGSACCTGLACTSGICTVEGTAASTGSAASTGAAPTTASSSTGQPTTAGASTAGTTGEVTSTTGRVTTSGSATSSGTASTSGTTGSVACGVQGNACGASPCCAGLECAGGVCILPQADAGCSPTCNTGESCVEDVCRCNAAACTNGFSCNGADRCVAGQCAAGGASCAQFSDCCSGTCTGSQCAACSAESGSCAAGQSCCEGLLCYGGSCLACQADSAPCTTADQCCSNICTMGSCTACAAQGAACQANGDCCSGSLCSSGFCEPACEISGTIYVASTTNPTDACQFCNPVTNPSGWSNRTDGTSCGQGEVCYLGNCQPGCYEGTTFYAPGALCATGQICDTGVCEGACYIAGAFFNPADPNPNNPCQTCQPGSSVSQFTPLTDGTSCGGQLLCENGNCGAGCTISGASYPSGAIDPADACDSCEPQLTTTDWSQLTDGTSCDAGAICSVGTCAAGCYIGGSFEPFGVQNPLNLCQLCAPDAGENDWTTANDGTDCSNGDAGAFCASGNCLGGCFVDGGVYPTGTADPLDPCLICGTGTGFAPNNGVTCDAGAVCFNDACTIGCFDPSIPGVVPAGTASASNVCETCQPAVSVDGYSTLPNGSACDAGSYCDRGLCTYGCFVSGTFYASGSYNPANSCQTCNPAASAGGFSTAVLSAPGELVTSVEADLTLAGDFNGDGLPDVMTLSDAGSATITFLAQSDGGFGGSSLSVSLGAEAVAIAADVNGDGFADIVSSDDTTASTLNVYLNQQNGSFAPAATYALPFALATAIVAVDLNGDGLVDLAVASGTQPIVLLFNAGSGTFGAAVSTTLGDPVIQLVTADFDGDGVADLAGLDGTTLDLWISTDDGGFSFSNATQSDFSASEGLAAGDLDGDGLADIAVPTYNPAGIGPGAIAVLLSGSPGGLSSGSPTLYPVSGTYPFAVNAVDVTGDGAADLVFADNSTPGIQGPAVLVNLGHGTFVSPEQLFPSGSGTDAYALAVGVPDAGLPTIFAGDFTGVWVYADCE